MGLLDRLNLLIRSNLNARSDERDERRRYDQTLGDMRTTVREARAHVNRVLDDERDLEAEIDALRKREELLEEKAMERLRDGNEDAAREILLKRNDIGRRADAKQEQLADHRAYLSDLMRALDALENKIGAVRDRAAVARDRRGRHSSARAATRELRSDRDIRQWERLVQRRRRRPSGRPRTGSRRPRSRASGADFSFERSTRNERRAREAMGEIDASLDRFREYEDKLDRMEADIEAASALDFAVDPHDPALDPDDPLYDPKLADMERRFRELERRDRDED